MVTPFVSLKYRKPKPLVEHHRQQWLHTKYFNAKTRQNSICIWTWILFGHSISKGKCSRSLWRLRWRWGSSPFPAWDIINHQTHMPQSTAVVLVKWCYVKHNCKFYLTEDVGVSLGVSLSVARTASRNQENYNKITLKSCLQHEIWYEWKVRHTTISKLMPVIFII